MRLKISARRSDLARLQAYHVGEALIKAHPNLSIEYKFSESLGDKNLTDPLWKIPEKGLFTEDLHAELMRKDTDLLVHSWKDLPTENKSETMIAATLPRADQRDLLLVKKSHFDKISSLKSLKIFSSSPRREYNLGVFLKNHLPFALDSVKFENVRGNIPTRIKKLLESTDVDALIVAKAALDRLLSAEQEEFKNLKFQLRSALTELQWCVLPLSINPNAAAQGALAIEILKARQDLIEILKPIHDEKTFYTAQKEREILASHGGGCHQKIGVAVLLRSYGEIIFIQGLTDAGQLLNQRQLLTPNSSPKFPKAALYSHPSVGERRPLEIKPLNSEINALFVSRSEAWPKKLKSSAYIWTSGLKTWQNLAQRGHWVHGTTESLGEQEDPQIEILAGHILNWAKLTHTDGFESAKENFKLIPTYKVQYAQLVGNFMGKDAFFWHSGRQFLIAAQKSPEILGKFHACGPGNTYQIIRNYLLSKNNLTTERLRIFLDHEDWRKQCSL